MSNSNFDKAKAHEMLIPQVLDPLTPHSSGWDHQIHGTTANLTAGLKSLEELGSKMTKQALGWKLLVELKECGIGTNEIENQARKRKKQRDEKRGKLSNTGLGRILERDKEHVINLMKIRIQETKQDWKEAKEKFRKARNEISGRARNGTERNYIKKEIKRIDRSNAQIYSKGRENHTKKVDHLKAKHKPPQIQPSGRKMEPSEWIKSVAEGNPGAKPEKQVPVYGETTINSKEKAAMSMPPKFPTLSCMREENIDFESALAQTKIRYHRTTNGSPEEQIQALEAGEPEVPDDATIVERNLNREVYNPTDKSIDFGKLRATDLQNNPRIYLPKPRPDREEIELAARAHLMKQATLTYMQQHTDSKGNLLE